MKLQTKVPLKEGENQIDYNSRLVVLGSCFANNIGDKLAYYKFQALQNPFGILFHPLAIENLIWKAINKYEYSERDIFQLNGRWHCFDAHSDLSSGTQEELLKQLNDALSMTYRYIKGASHIIITLGTAWVYQHEKRNQVVANCHKVPQKEFDKRLLTVDEISNSLQRMLHKIETINQGTSIVFTISPVRHLKDGFIENQRSKSHLIAAVHGMLCSLPLGAKGLYFPSYELMMDELRDYRFYATDLVHPNDLAIAYIWEKFKRVWMAETCFNTMDQVEAIQKGLQHRPFNAESEKHQEFLKTLDKKIAYLQMEYPFMKF
ncbi:MAG: GSCFA domain-containing protein [Flavobacteriaceae bacterium]